MNKKNNASIKEKFKQEKKAEKKQRAEAINKRYEEKRAMKSGQESGVGSRESGFPQSSYRQKNKGLKRASTDSRLPAPDSYPMPLNKFLSHSGIGSRRDAVPLIKEGKVLVNGKVVSEPGFKVTEKDVVEFNGKKLFMTKNRVYILLNKPKDYITTADDPQNRKTVFDLIKSATSERIYPVGRLDRNTSGVLLFTNDGELTQKLTHPSYEVKKVYEVKLDKPLTMAHFEKILNGVRLEDGEIRADELGYPYPNDRSIVGIEIHSGRNRIVRRIFESMGYKIKGLDRVMYGDLTKKNVERGKWRYLSEKEIRLLKHSNPSRQSKKKNNNQEGNKDGASGKIQSS